MIDRALFCCAVLGFFLLGGSPLASAAESGWVLEFDPPGAPPALTNAGISIPQPLRLGSPLAAGDLLQVPAGARLLVGLADGSEREISGPGRWIVPAASPRSTIVQMMQGLLGVLDRDGSFAASAATRDGAACAGETANEALRLPIFEKADQRIRAGARRTLALGWVGGCPPFEATVLQRGTVVAKSGATKESVSILRAVNLPVGNFEVRVRDGRGSVTSGRFSSVATLPAASGDKAPSSIAMRDLGRALWLASLDEGHWKLESAQQLQSLVDGKHELAEAALLRLLWDPEWPAKP